MTVEFANIPPHAARALAVFMGGSHGVPAIDDLPTDTRYQWIAPWRR